MESLLETEANMVRCVLQSMCPTVANDLKTCACACRWCASLNQHLLRLAQGHAQHHPAASSQHAPGRTRHCRGRGHA